MSYPNAYPFWIEAETAPGNWTSDLGGHVAGVRSLEEAVDRVAAVKQSGAGWASRPFRLVDVAGRVVSPDLSIQAVEKWRAQARDLLLHAARAVEEASSIIRKGGGHSPLLGSMQRWVAEAAEKFSPRQAASTPKPAKRLRKAE